MWQWGEVLPLLLTAVSATTLEVVDEVLAGAQDLRQMNFASDRSVRRSAMIVEELLEQLMR